MVKKLATTCPQLGGAVHLSVLGISYGWFKKIMVSQTSAFIVVLISLASIIPTVCEAQFTDKGNYVEVTPGTKLCDPAEDVYGFYLVKSEMKPNGTKEVEYYRFGALPDAKTATLEHILQRSLTVWFRRHPLDNEKLQVMDAVTGQADEFPYAVCKRQYIGKCCALLKMWTGIIS